MRSITHSVVKVLSLSASVHILSGDLILHKRTIAPIKTMIYGLRRYDVDRSIALANMYRDPISGSRKHHLDMDAGDTGTSVAPADTSVSVTYCQYRRGSGYP